MKLTSQRILITGGTSGIGREIVDQLAEANELIVIGRNPRKLTDLTRNYASVSTRCCDLAEPGAVTALIDDLSPAANSIDVLLCNAAVQREAWITDPKFDFAGITAEVAINFTSICQLVCALGPRLRTTDGPAMIALINSGLALSPKASSAVYCATKAALRSFGRSIGYQLEDHQVRVTQAFLPLVDTPMTAGRDQKKLSVQQAARAIIAGIESERAEFYVGQSRWLHRLQRISPPLVNRIMRRL